MRTGQMQSAASALLPVLRRAHDRSQRLSPVERAHTDRLLDAVERSVEGIATPEDEAILAANRVKHGGNYHLDVVGARCGESRNRGLPARLHPLHI